MTLVDVLFAALPVVTIVLLVVLDPMHLADKERDR